MTKILLIRHGQSMANVDGVFAGHFDSPPSELGLVQAEKTAEYIVSSYNVSEVYSSDLKRAMAVGTAVAKKLGLKPITNKALREIYAGEWESKTFDELFARYETYRNVWLHNIGNVVCDGGESVAQLQARFVSAVKKIAEENRGKTVVIATHATPIRSFICYCEGRPLDEMKDIRWVTNSSVSEFEYENGEFTPISIGYDEHLGELTSRLPVNV